MKKENPSIIGNILEVVKDNPTMVQQLSHDLHLNYEQIYSALGRLHRRGYVKMDDVRWLLDTRIAPYLAEGAVEHLGGRPIRLGCRIVYYEEDENLLALEIISKLGDNLTIEARKYLHKRFEHLPEETRKILDTYMMDNPKTFV